jgi:hypothetical protein
MVTLDRGIDVRNLFGGKFLPQEMVLQSMGMLEQRLTAEFHQRSRLNAELAQQARKASARLLDQVRGDQGAADAVAKLRSIGANIRDRELRDPHRAEVKEGVYAGSIGAVVKPPYDYQWTWSAVSGNPADNTEVANKSSGKMSLVFDTDESDNSSSISGRAAVGIYFYPPADNGTLQVWSSPAFTDQWYDICSFDSAHADGWIGLFIESYDLTGAPTGILVDQQVSLWNDSSWWSGGTGQGSNAGFGLSSPPIQVDQDHQYAIWVWAGGYVSAEGWGTFSGSGAGDQLKVTVPSIRWRLG